MGTTALLVLSRVAVDPLRLDIRDPDTGATAENRLLLLVLVLLPLPVEKAEQT